MKNNAGFSLLELSIVLVVIGVLTAMTTISFQDVDKATAIRQAKADLSAANSALKDFLILHKRLPCPDVGSGTGFKGPRDDFEDCESNKEVGGFPYATLGLNKNVKNPLEYAVPRYPKINGMNYDLTTAYERTGDTHGRSSYQSYGDAIVALQALMLYPEMVSKHPYIGSLKPDGAVDCKAPVAVAWILISPLQDSDGDGNVLDGENTTKKLDDHCFSHSDTKISDKYDDLVLTERPEALIGLLAGFTH